MITRNLLVFFFFFKVHSSNFIRSFPHCFILSFLVVLFLIVFCIILVFFLSFSFCLYILPFSHTYPSNLKSWYLLNLIWNKRIPNDNSNGNLYDVLIRKCLELIERAANATVGWNEKKIYIEKIYEKNSFLKLTVNRSLQHWWGLSFLTFCLR